MRRRGQLDVPAVDPALLDELPGGAAQAQSQAGYLELDRASRANAYTEPMLDAMAAGLDALSAEARADAYERELLTSVLAGLARQPGLSARAIAPYREALVAARASAGAAVEAAHTLGAVQGEELAYATSYDIRPDSSFVGYAGLLFYA